jgi:hypothetical protein
MQHVKLRYLFSDVGVGFSVEVKRLRRGADHPPVSSAHFVNGLELYLRLASVPSQWCRGVTFTFVHAL